MSSENVQFNYLPIAPIESIENDAVFDALEYSLSESQKNIHNIAISGPYGAGKSSVWKSFLRNEKYKVSEKNVLEISMAKFDEIDGNNVFSEDKPVENEDFSLERSILQQILFSVEKCDVPCVDSYKIFSGISGLAILFAVAAGIIVFHFGLPYIELSNLTNFYGVSLFEKNMFVRWLPVILTIVLYLVVSFISLKVYHFFEKGFEIKFSSFKFKEFEFSFDYNKGSLFNQNIASLVYFFERTEIQIVAFEDLDRFPSNRIFVKLRELNQILNGCPKLKKKQVKFVYMVREDLFSMHDRTKFFQFIIPVRPFISFDNCAKYLENELKKIPGSNEVDSGLLDNFSYFVNESRVVNDCINEFQIYKKAFEDNHADLKSDSQNKGRFDSKLFALVAYKNCFPGDFERLHRGEGVLFEILNNAYKHQAAIEVDPMNNRKTVNEIYRTDSPEIELNDIFKKSLEKYQMWIRLSCLKLVGKYKSDAELINAVETNQPNLLYSMIAGGFIDESYKIFISDNISGTLQKNDYEYLMIVKNMSRAVYDKQIENVEELRQKIRGTLWRSTSSLNYRMLAYLLSVVDGCSECESILEKQIFAMVDEKKNGIDFYKNFVDFYNRELKNKKVLCHNRKYISVQNDGPSIMIPLFKTICSVMNEHTLEELFGE